MLQINLINMRNKILTLIFATFFVSNSVFAQKCATYEGYLENQIEKYPDFYNSIKEKNNEIKFKHDLAISKIQQLKSENGIKIIPVVVHVIHDLGNENISDASIQGALDILNANINGQGANFLARTPDVFAAVRGEARVEFRLAKIDPIGNPTTGINRVRSTLTNEPTPRDGVKSLSYWNSFEYFNIWTVKKFAPQDDGNTLLGYAQFPSSGSMSTDGVVLLSSQMVSGGTLTHEVGHWLGLRHTWGDATCGDDGIKDTPPARDPNFGVNISDYPYHVGLAPPAGQTGTWGCLGDSLNWAGEMFVNYMDYSSDADVTMFTKDQASLMNSVLDGVISEETGLSTIGFREYMWSTENIESTGTIDGYRVPTCTQEATFVVMNGASSICEGEALLLKGNQTMFGAGNVTSFVWEFGDGNTDSSGDNFISHTYNTTGSLDVTLNVEYNETTEARSPILSDLDLITATSYDSIIETLIIQGTQLELTDQGATNIIEISLDSIGLYWGLNDSSYYRGELEKTTYVAYYSNNCISSVTKEGFVTVNPQTSSSAATSYSYSFESESELNGDWVLSQSTNIESQWSFNSGDNTIWKWENGSAYDGSSSIMVAEDDMLVGVSTEIISKSYDLSSFTNPAIKFSWAGAAVNTFPVNELAVTYSDDCGESWRSLETIGAVEASSAGLYTSSFKPSSSQWNSIVLTKAQLKNSNVRFKFEYIVNGSSNNFYLDNILIGEESSLQIIENNNEVRLALFPNPAESQTIIALENIVDQKIQVSLINILGTEVKNLFNGSILSNYQEIPVNLTSLEKGVYFVKVVSNGNVIMTEKLMLNR